MFSVGDKVVYPMHGAGIIESIEEKDILGERKQYYVMHLPIGHMKVMVPVDGVEEIGLREVVDDVTFEQVLEVLKSDCSKMSANWNKRYRANAEKLKSGDILEVAEVVRNLTLRDMDKGLSTGERRMLENARQILLSEIALVRGVDEASASALIEEAIAN